MVTAREPSALARETHELLSGELRAILHALVAEEPANRRRLYRLREAADYDAAWTTPAPLVTVTVATRARARLLAERSLPSILGQTYENLEVIVVGDDADEATADGSELARRSASHVPQSHPAPGVHHRRRPPLARRLHSGAQRGHAARDRTLGRCFDDDDAMAPTCVERLLARAREERLRGGLRPHDHPHERSTGRGHRRVPAPSRRVHLGERHVPRRPPLLRPRARRRRPGTARRLVPGPAHAPRRRSLRERRRDPRRHLPSRVNDPEPAD